MHQLSIDISAEYGDDKLLVSLASASILFHTISSRVSPVCNGSSFQMIFSIQSERNFVL